VRGEYAGSPGARPFPLPSQAIALEAMKRTDTRKNMLECGTNGNTQGREPWEAEAVGMLGYDPGERTADADAAQGEPRMLENGVKRPRDNGTERTETTNDHMWPTSRRCGLEVDL